jgi:hypothetical protein
MLNRRSLITGLISLVAAPAIVRAGSLMPVRSALLPAVAPRIPLGQIRGGMLKSGEVYFVIYNGAEWLMLDEPQERRFC